MIEIKSIFYKNFQSVGNAGITIQIDRSPTTLVGGQNGSGKSTLLEAVSYSLFGKTLKKVKLSGLINSINKKAMLTEIVFMKNGDEYKVVRGEKPKKFEIWKNGEMLDQNAASKDYQATLERIIGMDHKLFTQIVLLNRERYVPFMELSAADRRKVVEDILDINVFGFMNTIVKESISKLSNESSDIEYERGLIKTKIEGVNRLIEQAQSNIDEQVTENEAKIAKAEKEIKDKKAKVEELSKQLTDLEALRAKQDKLKMEKDQLTQFSVKFNSKIEALDKELAFYKDNDNCPTCNQEIDGEFKASVESRVTDKKTEIQDSSKKLYEKARGVVASLTEVNKTLEEMNSVQSDIRDLEREISFCERNSNDAANAITKLKAKKSDQDFDGQLKELQGQVATMDKTLETILSEKADYEVMKGMLKDDGIKASIVDDYVGFINQRMNEYLNAMGFFINITLDGNFNETVNSISREGFTYENLSTGQKTRVSLAIWLVLLEVSAMKNNAVTNLIFVDEILENLDQDGVALFMGLVKEKLSHKNFFVVTQRFDEFKDYFRSEIYFEQGEDGFTKIQ